MKQLLPYIRSLLVGWMISIAIWIILGFTDLYEIIYKVIPNNDWDLIGLILINMGASAYASYYINVNSFKAGKLESIKATAFFILTVLGILVWMAYELSKVSWSFL